MLHDLQHPARWPDFTLSCMRTIGSRQVNCHDSCQNACSWHGMQSIGLAGGQPAAVSWVTCAEAALKAAQNLCCTSLTCQTRRIFTRDTAMLGTQKSEAPKAAGRADACQVCAAISWTLLYSTFNRLLSHSQHKQQQSLTGQKHKGRFVRIASESAGSIVTPKWDSLSPAFQANIG